MIDPENRPSFPFDRATYPAPPSFASQKVLLAVIFCVGSAPDKSNEHQNEVFRNNSVVFSRMRAIWGVGNYLVEEVSDGEVSRPESRSHDVPGRNN
jgi:hypothetical protein